MDMTAKAVFGICNERQAETALIELRNRGFSNGDISVLVPDMTSTHDLGYEQHTKAPEGTATGVTTGGILGGTVGWLAGIGALAIPGLGAFIAAGPIMATLSGIAVGGTVGGVTGALVGFGIPEYEAKQYEGKLVDGNILLSVHTGDGDELKLATDILQRCGAHGVSSSAEASA